MGLSAGYHATRVVEGSATTRDRSSPEFGADGHPASRYHPRRHRRAETATERPSQGWAVGSTRQPGSGVPSTRAFSRTERPTEPVCLYHLLRDKRW